MRTSARWAGVVAVIGVTGLGAQAPAPKASAQAAPGPPTLPGKVIALIQAEAKETYSTSFLGLSDYQDGSTRLYVTSSRAGIAYKTKQADDKGGRYTPTASDRVDSVLVNCGDSDLGEIFECSKVRVFVGERVVKPIRYTAGPRAYRNALGGRWTVREVSAAYAAKALRDGFVVEYADFDGTEWTYEVPADKARWELLLRIELDEP